MSAIKLLSAATLFRIALPLAFVVVVAGAYTRIADAGLGCPDWPGCYGKLVGVPSAAEAAEYLASGAKDAPGGFDRQKAVIEIAHRYIAGLLGLLILAAAFLARKDGRRYFVGAMLLVVLVCAQALLGMATVTDNLRPAVVLSHLLGGMLILFILARLAFNSKSFAHSNSGNSFGGGRLFYAIAVIVLFAQLALGGWVSASYAGLACGDFPLCNGSWIPHRADFSGFHPQRELHKALDGTQISNAALATMHWLHRAGAVVAFLVLAIFALVRFCGGRRGVRLGGGLLLLLLIMQVAVGIVVVLLRLPVLAALAHNAIAALLVINIAYLAKR